MEILKRCCPTYIYNLHISMILIFLCLNLGSYVWSIYLNYDIYNNPDCINNEPHKLLLTVYVITYGLIYIFVAGLLIGLKF